MSKPDNNNYKKPKHCMRIKLKRKLSIFDKNFHKIFSNLSDSKYKKKMNLHNLIQIFRKKDTGKISHNILGNIFYKNQNQY